MHNGAIPLPDPIIARCLALINLGSMLRIYSINAFGIARGVADHMNEKRISVLDLQDIKRLCVAINENDQINDSLRGDITELFAIVDLFIQAASSPARPCGMWSMAFTP